MGIPGNGCDQVFLGSIDISLRIFLKDSQIQKQVNNCVQIYTDQYNRKVNRL